MFAPSLFLLVLILLDATSLVDAFRIRELPKPPTVSRQAAASRRLATQRKVGLVAKDGLDKEGENSEEVDPEHAEFLARLASVSQPLGTSGRLKFVPSKHGARGEKMLKIESSGGSHPSDSEFGKVSNHIRHGEVHFTSKAAAERHRGGRRERPRYTGFELYSVAFDNETMLPSAYTCEADARDGRPPPLAWRGAPAAAKSFALVMEEAIAERKPSTRRKQANLPPHTTRKVHWAWFNFDRASAARTRMNGVGESDALSIGAIAALARNDFASQRAPLTASSSSYEPPCPPRDSRLHRYHFTLYALDVRLAFNALDEAPWSAADLRRHMRGHVLDSSLLIGTYAYGGPEAAREADAAAAKADASAAGVVYDATSDGVPDVCVRLRGDKLKDEAANNDNGGKEGAAADEEEDEEEEDEEMEAAVYAVLRGRVQGVSLRPAVKEQAVRRRVEGFIRNLPDGSVELVARGRLRKVCDVLRFAEHGHKKANVKKLTARFVPPNSLGDLPNPFKIQFQG